MSRGWTSLLALALTSACATASPVTFSRAPRSVLVVPPLNGSPEPIAPRAYLSTVSRPLAERGYYVFPVAVVERMMIDNGLPTPDEMNQVPREKLAEVFGCDAILYGRITSWGTKYQILNSNTAVEVESRLVDARSGETLWKGKARADRNSIQGGATVTDPLAFLITAAVTAAVSQIVDSSDEDAPRVLAARASADAFAAWPPGPYRIEERAEAASPPKEKRAKRSRR